MIDSPKKAVHFKASTGVSYHERNRQSFIARSADEQSQDQFVCRVSSMVFSWILIIRSFRWMGFRFRINQPANRGPIEIQLTVIVIRYQEESSLPSAVAHLILVRRCSR
jgi:hypothetical protein